MTSTHTRFAAQVVAKHDDLLIDYGPDEQAGRVLEALRRVSSITPFTPADGSHIVDLAGFGKAPIVYTTADEQYVLLSDVAEALGWPLHKADAWARREYGYALQDQRDQDEKRGDGRLGWECLLGYIDLGLDLVEDDPEAKPDAGGRRWSHSGDWLIGQDRLPALLCSSPWGKEFLDNVGDHMGLMLQQVLGDKLKNSPTVHVDGTPTGSSAWDLFSTALTEEEALRKARRGPTLDDEAA